MAIKTKDYVVDVNNLNEDITLKTKQGTALYFKGKTFQDVISDNEIAVVGNDLVITTSNSKKITILDYFRQNGKNSFKYIKTDEVNELGFLTNIIDYGVVQNPNKIGVPIKGTTVNGTVFSDEINVSSYTNIPISGKGVNIKANSGNDLIIGSLGNDTITGGTGTNTIEYKEPFGNDVINLTKNENLKIDLSALNINSDENIYQIVKNDLLLNTDYGTITIKNFVSKDVTGTNGSVEVVLSDKTIDLNSTDMHKYFIYDETDISSKRTLTTKRLSEVIDMTDVEQVYDKKGNPLAKGVNINAGAGDDEITGSYFNDTIKGGLGENTINYSLGSGKDIINLTKGENLTINLQGISSSDVQYSIVKKDLVLTFSNGETLTLKNFGTKDVTNNSTKKSENTSSVILTFDGENPIDLRLDNYLLTAIVEKSKYSGNWHSETIDAKDYQLYKTVKIDGQKVKVENDDVNAKGVSISASNGNDEIVGSKYRDTIKSGNDNDTITAGTGNDKIYGDAGKNYIHFNLGDGADTVYSNKKGNDILVFENASLENLTFERVKNNLVISGYGTETDSVTVTNFYKGYNSVQSIKTKEGEFKLPDNFINLPIGTTTDDYIWGTSSSELINANSGNDVILAGNGNDTINAGDGNDTVLAGKGNDRINSSVGNNEFIFNTGDGNDLIEKGTGSDTICFIEEQNLIYTNDLSTNNLIISYGDNDSIALDKYFTNGHSVDAIQNGDKNVLISEEINKNLTIVDTSNSEEINGINGNDVFVLSGGSDTINSSGGVDTIKFENLQELTYKRIVGCDDLIIEYGSGNSVTIKDYYSANGTSVKNIQNGNSTETLQQALQNGLKIELPDTKTSLDLTTGNNEVTSGKGNDTVNITGGNNLIIFNKNSGNDTITGYSLNDTLKFEDDTVHSWEKVANSLAIYYNEVDGEPKNRVVLKDFFLNTDSNVNIIDNDTISTVVDYAVVNIIGGYNDEINESYLNDSIISGSKGHVIYAGTGEDTINGGAGNDLMSSSGACTYEFSLGDGNDTISHLVENSQIVFSTKTDISFSKNADSEDLIISYNNAQDTITIKSYFLGQSICTIKNGSEILDLPTEIAKKLTIIGTSSSEIIMDKTGNDYIQANYGYDSIYSYSGNDTIYLGAGNDILSASSNTDDLIVYGGVGDDSMQGGTGYDTFVFEAGDGFDTIATQLGTTGLIKFEEEQNNLKYSYDYDSNDVVISYNNLQDSITIKDYFLNSPDLKIQNVSWQIFSLSGQLSSYADLFGTNEADYIVGRGTNSEFIYALDGDDTINGNSGDDNIYGGKGNDYIVESGWSFYNFSVGDGNDKVQLTGDLGIYNFGTIISDVYFQKNANSNDLIIYYNESKDSVTLIDYFSVQSCSRKIRYKSNEYKLSEKISEALLLKGTGADDVIEAIYGTSTIEGGAGNNSYIFSKENETTILNGLGMDTITFKNVQEISFGKNHSSNDLFINYGQEGQIILKDYFVNNSHSVSTIIRDNETLSISDLLVAGYQTNGTDNDDTISGTLGNDYIDAKSGNDIIYGRDGNDTIIGGSGNDTLYGCTDSSSEVITTDNNEYVFRKGHGKDTVILGRGTDTLKIDTAFHNMSYSKDGNNLVINYSDTDSVILKDYLTSTMPTVKIIDANGVEKTLAEALIKLNITGATSISGTDFNDYIIGSDNYDAINSGKGDDSIYAGAGDDRINCSYGNDYVEAGDGNDILQGEYNDDTLLGGAGNDYIYGGLGNDSLIGNEGNDSLYGNDGDDILIGSLGIDLLDGGNGCDTLIGDKGNDSLYGGSGNDSIIGGIGYDSICGNDGSDTLIGSAASDTLDGGNGNDLYVFNVGDGYDYIYLNSGTDTVKFNCGLSDIDFSQDSNTLQINYSTEIDDCLNIWQYFKYENVDDVYTYSVNSNCSVKNIRTIEGTFDIEKVRNGLVDYLTDKVTIDSGSGDDQIKLWSGIYNNQIKSGDGNDYIIFSGDNNTIIGGAGNDKISIQYDTELSTQTNILEFNIGDGNDTIFSQDTETILIFNETFGFDIELEKLGAHLIIKYNTTGDSVTIQSYFDTDILNQENYIIEYGYGTKTRESLADFVSSYGTISNITINEINGTDDDDYIDLSNIPRDTVINAGSGDDQIKLWDGLYNNRIDCGAGNDYAISSGDGNLIVGGTGNDKITIQGDTESTTTTNTIRFYNGDGNDTISSGDTETVLQFNDASTSDLKLEKYNTHLVIKYNSDADSITLQSYFDEYQTNPERYTIEDKEGNRISLADFISSYGSIPNLTVTEIIGTDADDYIDLVDISSGTTISSGSGDDQIKLWSGIYNNQINSGEGNDFIIFAGDNNTIIGGAGNDKISIQYDTELSTQSNTLEFNIGDGNDTISSGDTETILTFNDASTSDLKLEKYNTHLVIKYNSDADSITLQSYFDEDQTNPERYTIEDKNGNKTSLADFISSYGSIPNLTITEITGTEADDYIDMVDISVQDTTYSVELDKISIIDDVEGDDVLIIDDKTNSDLVHVVFNVSKDYKNVTDMDFANVTILDNTNLEQWKTGLGYTGVVIKNNAIETISLSDGYSITSTQISELAEAVTSWLSTNGYDDVQTVLDTQDSNLISEMMLNFDVTWQQV